MNELEEGKSLNLQFNKREGLLPVVVQEEGTGQILMVGYTNREALDKTFETGFATFWSRSRNALWTKGETSGNKIRVNNILVDCDQDALVYQVVLAGEGVCHTTNSAGKARKSCFYREIAKESQKLEFVGNDN